MGVGLGVFGVGVMVARSRGVWFMWVVGFSAFRLSVLSLVGISMLRGCKVFRSF